MRENRLDQRVVHPLPEEWIGEFATLPLRAIPRIVEAESAQTDRTVFFRNIEINNVIAAIGTWVGGGTGWGASIGGCTGQPFIAPDNQCSITVRANGAAGDGALVLYQRRREEFRGPPRAGSGDTGTLSASRGAGRDVAARPAARWCAGRLA